MSIRSSRVIQLVDRHYRWFVAVPVAVVAVAVVAALVPWPAFLPEGRGLAGAVDRNLITPLVLAAIAYFYFYFLTAHRATRELLVVARQTPEKMFPHSPEAGSAKQVFGRDQLIEEIANGVCAPEARPQIVVGGTGSGKTTLLLALASHLADKHAIVPIVLSLRDEDNDLVEKFTKLAVRRFEELVDPHVNTREEADKLWRWMRKRRRIVVLADDLDRSRQVNKGDPNRTQIRLALDEAGLRNLPLVVTTRPSGLPSGLREPPIDLADYKLRGKQLKRKDLKRQHGNGTRRRGRYLKGKERATEYVLERAGVRKRDETAYEKSEGLVERNIEDGELLENAFYLGLLADLLRAGALAEPVAGGKHAVRHMLLDADRDVRTRKGTRDEDERKQRHKALCGVEDLAAAWLAPTDGKTLKAPWELIAVRDGERFGLLTTDNRQRPQFTHEVLHAYYASKAIARGKGWKSMLRQKPNGARVRLTLVLRAAGGDSEDFCREACDRLLEDVGRLTPDQRLLRIAGAAELALAGSFSARDREIAIACLEAKADAGSVAKRAALKQLKTLGGKDAVDALWEYAQDDDYGTRWAAVECLIRRCTAKADGTIRSPYGKEASEVVEEKIGDALALGCQLLDRGGRADDWDPVVILLKQVAWMLPSLRTGVEDPGLHTRLDEDLKELLRLECRGVAAQRGLEASIAQGFKADAWRDPTQPPDYAAERMLRKRAVFWYSQLNLVHALALRMALRSDYTPGSLRPIMKAVKRRELERAGAGKESAAETKHLHPMLRQTVKLCKKALKGEAGSKRLDRMMRGVWRDESVVVARRPRKLNRKAAQLAGEVTVLLNLHETGDFDQRRTFAEKVTLPHCLNDNRWRHEFDETCREGCGFGLCPVQSVHYGPSSHRELSRAFCRDQRQRASFWPTRLLPRRGVLRVPPGLWRRLEDQARS